MASSINSGNFSNQPIKGRKAAEKTEAGGQEQTGTPVQDGFTASAPAAPQAPPSTDWKAAAADAHAAVEKLVGKLDLTPPEGGYVNGPVYDPATGTLTFPNWQGNVSDIVAHEVPSGWFPGGTHEGAHLTGPGVAASLQSIGASPANAGLSDTAFTNGLGSTQLMSLSGRVLADLSPFKS